MAAPSRGEYWLAEFDPTIGHEQAGRRPALVLSVTSYNQGRSGLVVVVPLTTTIRSIPINVFVGPPETQRPSEILCDQIRAISGHRLVHKIGEASQSTMLQVEERIRALLDL